ncbi:Gag-pol fusion protein [Phytophthora cinnamomi]|uniref:Gag-pol fusion protein n=1 Tax=Phytophthora cinnamomi TaxID=4785 RepID=UPI00355A57A5|nr:Gag-pol fusion protein [Phytophthora cinnamomi]
MTRLLVKQRPKPRTLEEAVDKATEINDPIDNVAQGMENIGQAFVTAPDSYVVPASGTTGNMAIIPGVGSAEVAEEAKLAFFTNSRGVYNKYTGLWEAQKGRAWNAHMWAPLAWKRTAPAPEPTATKRTIVTKTDKNAKVNMAMAVEDDDEQETEDDDTGVAPTPPPAKKARTTARRPMAATRQVKGIEAPRPAAEAKSMIRRFNENRC